MIERLLAGERMLAAGMVDRAEELFEQVAEADPRNSIAVVGLARVAVERGNLDDAIRLARRALEIDADNAAAGRMVDRLREDPMVRATTIEPEPAPESEPAPEPEPEREAARRSWLDRILDLFRRR